MDSVESKLEFIDNVIDSVNDIDNYNSDKLNDDETIFIENEITSINDIDENLYNYNKNKNVHLFFTNIINNQKIQKNRKEYDTWLKNNYEHLKNIYYIIYDKYFLKNNVNLIFKDFCEFCFLYY
jgi:hypothetical protein